MSIKTTKTEVTHFICDHCGKKKEMESKRDMDGWIAFECTENNGIRLFEKQQTANRYESFNIPNKSTKVFCQKDCASRYLRNSLGIFLNEVQPFKKR